MRSKKIFFLICYLIFSASCGSGGGETSGESSSSGSPTLTADFVAASPSPQSGSVTLQKNRASGDIVYVDVKVTNISGVFGADIKLDFDSSKVEWAGSYEAGDFLEDGGAPIYQTYPEFNEIAVTLSNTQGTEVGGTGVLVTLPFRVLASGESEITLSSSKLTDSAAPIPNSISVSLWSGGTLKGF